MHEYIEVQFRRNNKPFRVKRQIATGIQFDEPDPATHTLNIGFRADDPITQFRMSRIQQIKGWQPGQFNLRVSVEDGSLVLRGDDAFSLPEGRYQVTINASDAKTKGPRSVKVNHDEHGLMLVDLQMDDRTIDVDLTGADAGILRVLDASTIDGQPGRAWVASKDVRPTRRACVLNLLASLRVTPGPGTPLLAGVRGLFHAGDERAYADVDPAFFPTVSTLAERIDKPFFAEGPPADAMHQQLLAAVWARDPTTRPTFLTDGLRSFRAEAKSPLPSLQLVIAMPQVGFDRTFADVDLDLANPLQDVTGLVIHLGELLTGKPTNHLDLRKALSTGKAGAFLCYKLRS
jgi:hypothetical protein